MTRVNQQEGETVNQRGFGRGLSMSFDAGTPPTVRIVSGGGRSIADLRNPSPKPILDDVRFADTLPRTLPASPFYASHFNPSGNSVIREQDHETTEGNQSVGKNYQKIGKSHQGRGGYV